MPGATDLHMPHSAIRWVGLFLVPSISSALALLTAMFTIRFLAPYGSGWRTQSFSSLEEARRMVAFYLSCGSEAHLL